MSSHTDTNAPMGITRITNTLAAVPLIIDLGFKLRGYLTLQPASNLLPRADTNSTLTCMNKRPTGN